MSDEIHDAENCGHLVNEHRSYADYSYRWCSHEDCECSGGTEIPLPEEL